MKAFRVFLLPLCLVLLAGCVASYKPHLSDTAGKVRIRMTGGTSGMGLLWPIADGKCGERVRLPQLLAYAEPVTGPMRPRDGTEMSPSYARAGMQGSPDPARSDVSELQLAPGRYLFALTSMSHGYGSTLWQCGVSVVADIDPSRQYEIELRLEGGSAAPQCRIVATRLDEQGHHALWRPYTLLAGKACPA
jgi:hypothetical protein